MQLPKAVLFDLDETLAPSFQAPSAEMIQALSTLDTSLPLAIISGAGFDRIKRDVLDRILNISDKFFVFPNSASQGYVHHNGTWQAVFNHTLSAEERAHIQRAIASCTQELSVARDIVHFGEQIIDREAQIAWTLVGVDAPPEIKKQWDPTGAKRAAIVAYLTPHLLGFDMLIGGASTIDITRKNINKAYGVQWLSQELGIPAPEMLYVGDALYEGGNDAVVIPTGIQTRMVTSPTETQEIINELITHFANTN
jgi:HAD superfamily hydrolase (TIGR01484 family)